MSIVHCFLGSCFSLASFDICGKQLKSSVFNCHGFRFFVLVV